MKRILLIMLTFVAVDVCAELKMPAKQVSVSTSDYTRLNNAAFGTVQSVFDYIDNTYDFSGTNVTFEDTGLIFSSPLQTALGWISTNWPSSSASNILVIDNFDLIAPSSTNVQETFAAVDTLCSAMYAGVTTAQTTADGSVKDVTVSNAAGASVTLVGSISGTNLSLVTTSVTTSDTNFYAFRAVAPVTYVNAAATSLGLFTNCTTETYDVLDMWDYETGEITFQKKGFYTLASTGKMQLAGATPFWLIANTVQASEATNSAANVYVIAAANTINDYDGGWGGSVLVGPVTSNQHIYVKYYSAGAITIRSAEMSCYWVHE